MRERPSRLLALAAVVAAAAVTAFVAVPGAGTAGADAAKARRVAVQAREVLLERTRLEIRRERNEAWRWLAVMSAPPTPYASLAERTRSLRDNLRLLRLWTRRAAHARWLAHHPPRLRAWLCIHRYEGAWNDPNPPYYGGLQMDLAFMRAYGAGLLRRKGTADHWTPLEQMWVAERAYRSGRGFSPWPNTARWCGLI
ncbi:MAG TPA: hypothetical protein VFA44_14815 [Gaiellaceae bacterium]|nr:hypothetical protein [Gaiellaceae bacterium]